MSVTKGEKLATEAAKERALANQRAKERRVMDQLTTLRQSHKDPNPMVYIIDSQWLNLWKAFINGGLSPGTITNSNLLRADGTIKAELVKVKDYRGLNAAEWHAFYDWYGGGPAIRREQMDIYSEAVGPNIDDLKASERHTKFRKAKQKDTREKPSRASHDEKQVSAEMEAMKLLLNLPVYAGLNDLRVNQMHDFNDSKFTIVRRQYNNRLNANKLATPDEITDDQTFIDLEQQQQHNNNNHSEGKQDSLKHDLNTTDINHDLNKSTASEDDDHHHAHSPESAKLVKTFSQPLLEAPNSDDGDSHV